MHAKSGPLKVVNLILILSLLITLSLNSPNFALAQEKESGIRTVQSTLDLLQKEYISNVDSAKLIKGAVCEMKTYCQRKKLRADMCTESAISDQRSTEANLRAFEDIYCSIIDTNGRVDEQELMQAALNGMTSVISKDYSDPYTIALSPKDYKNLLQQLNSEGFTGIGVFLEVDKKSDNKLIVVDTVEGSPAAKSGLKSGDIIVRINDMSTQGMDIEAASNRIRGPVNTSVKLHIQRKDKELDLMVLRSIIRTSSLNHKMIGNIGYIKLRFFGETTGDEFSKALADLEKNGARAVILDLRNNGGGYVNAAVDVCNRFARGKELITSVVNYRKHSREDHRAQSGRTKSLPLAVLVNGHSASASEITAGFVQDTGVGVIVGSKTFGKGSVQTIHRLANGGAIKYTSAHYTTPLGRDINKIGITPNIEVNMDPALIGSNNDAQLQKAISYLKTKLSKM